MGVKVKYQASVKTLAGWRPVSVVAEATLSGTGKMASITKVTTIDGEVPARGQSRTGAKRQEFDGVFWANREIGAKKRVSACEVIA